MVLIIGGTTIDFIIKKEPIKKATKIELRDNELFLNIGGGASNASFILSYLGTEVYLITKFGKDEFAEIIKKFYLKNKKIKLIKTKEHGKTAISFIFDYGDRVIYTYRGELNHIIESDLEEELPNYNWLYICSNKGETLKFVKKLIKKTKEENKKIFINPSIYMIDNSKQIFDYYDILILNKEEAQKLTGKKEIDKILKELNKNGKIGIITDGERGVYFREKNKNYFFDISFLRREPLDTTGAGDCFSATFFHFFISKKRNLIESIILAAINSSYIVTKIGTKHSLSEKSLLNILSEIKRKKIIEKTIKLM